MTLKLSIMDLKFIKALILCFILVFSINFVFADLIEIEYRNESLYGFDSDDKVQWKLFINDTGSSEEYDCISYVKLFENNVTGEIIQTNPQYTKKTQKFITKDGSYDDREFFTTMNNIGTIYFTKDNLIFDEREYVFGVTCVGNGNSESQERVVVVGYESFNSPLNIFVWGKENALNIVAFLIIVLLIISIIGFVVMQK